MTGGMVVEMVVIGGDGGGGWGWWGLATEATDRLFTSRWLVLHIFCVSEHEDVYTINTIG